MSVTSPNHQEVLAGDLYLNLTENGVKKGFFGPLNADEMTITSETTEIEQISRMKDTYGQTRSKVVTGSKATISMKVLDSPLLVKGLVYLGIIEEINVAAQTVTDEPITAGDLGNAVKLQYGNVTASSVVCTDNTGVTTYVEGTDYEIDYNLGWARPLATGSITANQQLLFDYTTGLVTGHRVRGNAETQKEVEIMLDGVNKAAANAAVEFHTAKAVIKPSGAANLLAAGFTEAVLEGEMVTVEGQNEPYTLEYK